MTPSFRLRLAARFALTMAVGLAVVSAVCYLAIRGALDRELNSTLLNVASMQAAAVTGAPGGRMEFHEWELTPAEAAAVRDLSRYAQVWTEDGQSLLRSRQLATDLPSDSTALAAAVAGELVWAEQRLDGLPVRSLYYPLGRMGPQHQRHVLQVVAPLAAHRRVLRTAVIFLAGIILLGSLVTLGGGWWLANEALQPVREIIAQAEAIRPGASSLRIQATAGTREYERLIQVLNSMLERLDAAHAAQRRFTADASHELRSPLTALRGELEIVRRRDRSRQEYERVIDSSLEEVGRLSRITEDLLTLARSDAGTMQLRLQEGDFAECGRRAVERLRARAEANEVALDYDAPGAVTGRFDHDLISRLVWNLAENAIKFAPLGGRVEVSVRARGDTAVLEVADTGSGIPEEELGRIFNRFHRVDDARAREGEVAGTGLGLSIAQAIVTLHQGTLTASNRSTGGALFRAELPRRPPSVRLPGR